MMPVLRQARGAGRAGSLLAFLAWGLAAGGQVLEDFRVSSGPGAQARTARTDGLRFVLSRAASTPVVDGELSDACWRDPSSRLGRFRLGLSAVLARHAREAWASYDRENLYLAVRLEREPNQPLRVNTREADNAMIWEDDEVEVFLDPFGTGTEYVQLILNSEGVLYDAAHRYAVVPDPRGASPGDTKLERATDAAWSSTLERRVVIGDRSWTVEMALPLRALGLAGAPGGHEVRFNITSADWDTKEYTCLSPTDNWHDPKQFGTLVLGEARVAVEELTLGSVGAGRNRARLRVRDVSGKAARYELVLTFRAGGVTDTARAGLPLPAGGVRTATLEFQAPSETGPWTADIQIVDATGVPVFAARKAGNLPAPLFVRLKSRAGFTDGAGVPVSVRVGLGEGSMQDTRLEARLVAGGDGEAFSQDLGAPPGGEITARLPVGRLAPGTYRLQIVATEGKRVIATAEDELRLGHSPFGPPRP